MDKSEFYLKPVYLLVGLYGGCLEDLKIFLEETEAKQARDKMLVDYKLTAERDECCCAKIGGIGLCRWNDENEVHLHKLKAPIIKLQKVVKVNGETTRLRSNR